jgi:hypothetical protein
LQRRQEPSSAVRRDADPGTGRRHARAGAFGRNDTFPEFAST